MSEKRFTFYGVDNGQSVLVSLGSDRHVMFDIKQRPDDAGDSDKTADIHSSLLKTLPKLDDSKRRHISAFCLSHSHLDHCQGVDRVFCLPSADQDDNDKLIQIDELWVTAAIFNDDVTGPTEYIKKEAKRRLDLFKSDKTSEKTEEKGNMLVVFGKNEDVPNMKKMPTRRNPTAGKPFNLICGESQSDWEVYVHCPFSYIIKKEDDTEETDKNESSLIVQVALENGDAKGRLLIGGDAGCAVWKTVNKKTVENGNTDKLEWDIFFSPHHGSYKFFTEQEHKEGREEAKNDPDVDSMEILERGLDSNWIVCSSRPVKEGNYKDKEPPHIEAITHYREKATKDQFVCLMDYPSESDPDPLVLRLTDKGLQKKAMAAAGVSTGKKTTSSPKRWG